MSVSFWLTYSPTFKMYRNSVKMYPISAIDTLCLVFISGLLLNPFFWHMKRYIVEELWRSTFRMMDISHCYHFHFLDNSQPVSRISWPYFSKDTCVISRSKKNKLIRCLEKSTNPGRLIKFKKINDRKSFNIKTKDYSNG